MPINVFVAGAPESVRDLVESLRKLGAGVHDVATGLHRARSESEADWQGVASDAFRGAAQRDARDADALAELYSTLSTALQAFADELNTVKSRMDQARSVAAAGGLKLMGKNLILEPGPTPLPPDEQRRQQKAFEEAKSTVGDARTIERTAHDKLLAALKANSTGLDGIGQRAAWSQAAAHATSPMGTSLAAAADAMDTQAAQATRAGFEKAMGGGPAAVRAMWSSMTSAQQADMVARNPQMVGGADGIPTVVRDQANRSLLARERQSLLARLRDAEGAAAATKGQPGARHGERAARAEELRQALAGLDRLDQQLSKPNKYLLGLDATANGRGHAIIASGNPDTADNVVTSVPGTYSDLGDAMDYVDRNDRLIQQAEQFAPGKETAAVTWAGYDSPPSLPDASNGDFAEKAKGDLARFQEGLRVTHEGPPSHNTVLGHSYGSTVVGYAARDHGVAADDIAFIGSPGVGVEQAKDLGVPPEHVWSGTSGEDIIDTYTPSLNPMDIGDGADNHWFGMNPSDPQFGGQSLATDPNAGHSDYWNRRESLDAMAQVVAGSREQGVGKP